MQKILLTTALFLVFGTSAFMSIYGLAAMFVSAGFVVVLMGLGMELGKIMAVIHLHRNWSALRWLAKGFYIVVIFALLMCTSAEILGYLTQHHVKGFSEIESNQSALVALNSEKKILTENIKIIDKTLAGLPSSYVTKQIKERQTAGYNEMKTRLVEITRERSNLKKMQIKNQAYSAPIFAAAKIFGIEATRAASMFILFLVLVLEPLSIGLAVAVSITWMPQHPDKKDNIDPVAKAILHLINKKGEFIGTVTELLSALNNVEQKTLCNSKREPMIPLILGRRLQSKPLQKEFIRNGIFMQIKNGIIELSKVEYPRASSRGRNT